MSSTQEATTPAATAAAAASAASAEKSAEQEAYENTLVQYVVVRKDLLKKPYKWNYGSIIGNACHASVASIYENINEEDVGKYLADTKQMHKVVLAAKDEDELVATAKTLADSNVQHKLWVEQPEMLRTCLAVRPYPRKFIAPFLRTLKLFR